MRLSSGFLSWYLWGLSWTRDLPLRPTGSKWGTNSLVLESPNVREVLDFPASSLHFHFQHPVQYSTLQILYYFFISEILKSTHHSWRKFKCGAGISPSPQASHTYPAPPFCGKDAGRRFLKLHLWNHSTEVTSEGSNMLSTMSNMSLTVVLDQNSCIWATYQFKLTVGGGGRLEWTHENSGL